MSLHTIPREITCPLTEMQKYAIAYLKDPMNGITSYIDFIYVRETKKLLFTTSEPYSYAAFGNHSYYSELLDYNVDHYGRRGEAARIIFADHMVTMI